MSRLLGTLCLVVGLSGLRQIEQPKAFTLQMEEVDGTLLVTLVADNASAREIAEAIALELDLEVEGFEGVQRSALVTAHLERRPTTQVLEYVLGSVGLEARTRSGVLSVQSAEQELTAEALYLRALAGYARATALFPNHPLAVDARFAQGDIEEKRGSFQAALGHYEQVLEKYRTSPRMPEALHRAGLMLATLGRWGDAANQFVELANVAEDPYLAERSRLELARCMVHTQSAARALHTLDLLDQSHPCLEDEACIERDLVRVEAMVATGEALEGLRLLDRLDGFELSLANEGESLRLRAQAFEALELWPEASQAWLVWSQAAPFDQRARALHKAAELALFAEDELAVVFIWQTASAQGLQEGLEGLHRQALEGLGIEEAPSPGDPSVMETLDLAEEWGGSGDWTRASAAMAPLYQDRRAFDEPLLSRVTAVWASCVEAEVGLEEAIAVLRENRSALQDIDNRRLLDRRAAELYESHGLFDRAIDAYQGLYR